MRPDATSSGSTVTETTTVTDSEGKKQTFYKSVTNIKQSWQQLGRRSKIFLLVYGAGALLNFSFDTYNGGLQSLIEHRKRINQSQTPRFETEWEAVRAGCARGSFERFWRGIFWPGSLASNVMPAVVLRLNPPPQK